MCLSITEQTHDFWNTTHKPLQLIQDLFSNRDLSVVQLILFRWAAKEDAWHTFIYGSTNSTSETLKCEICVLIIYISLPYLIFFQSIKHAPALSHTCATTCMQINALASWSAALTAKNFAKVPPAKSSVYSHFLLHLDILVIQDQTSGFGRGVMVRERTNHKNSEDCSWLIWPSEFVACKTHPFCHLCYKRQMMLFRNSPTAACRFFNK